MVTIYQICFNINFTQTENVNISNSSQLFVIKYEGNQWTTHKHWLC